MKFRFKKKHYILAFTQLLILLISSFSKEGISLLSYIDISFYVSSLLFLTSLLLYTINSGSYDVIGKSFNLAFSRGQNNRKFEDIPALSELITFNPSPLLFHGLANGLLMLISCCLYYFLRT
ncbi:DUF3899 domain-containing protein [Bacillus sp. ISL-40]|uniref:DUF3899 domain-containing protein n=1 Tax=unclassified Bacillus (in: firmicutes) TaxID=185979 RepID=UPI001BE7FEB1|nr:DUF3899 domain-containing protein [Bacillus sp. ISL-40]MBT2721715.1 DUF3899 domain-containing protein [Bacillus sp. ISL-46]MBT2740338.1 DUF3899 domain-containing protein [Bacillus sp. ISL-77]